jgi:hypothetical protein
MRIITNLEPHHGAEGQIHMPPRRRPELEIRMPGFSVRAIGPLAIVAGALVVLVLALAAGVLPRVM